MRSATAVGAFWMAMFMGQVYADSTIAPAHLYAHGAVLGQSYRTGYVFMSHDK